MRGIAHLAGMISLWTPLATSTQSNVDFDQKFAWAENVGWTKWRDADGGAVGVVVGDTVLSGFIWGENVGWINVGDKDEVRRTD